MGTMYWVRVGLMGIALVGVIMSIRHLNTARNSSRQGEVKSPVAKLIVGDGETEDIVLCPTRVAWLESADGTRIAEHSMKWSRDQNGQHDELNAIDVEKWFGQNCTIRAQLSDVGQNFQPVLRIGFISGSPQTLARAPSGEFEWQGKKFISRDLEQALNALPTLPKATQAANTKEPATGPATASTPPRY